MDGTVQCITWFHSRAHLATEEETSLSLLWQYLLASALSLATLVLFLHEPGFGDDLTYWSLAFDLHEIGVHAWSAHSFHDLRWPIWGVCWLWQAVFGPGLASYYCVPALALASATSLALAFGRLMFRSATGGWAAAVAMLFVPAIDGTVARMMPDIIETALGGAVVLAWWAMMNANNRSRIVVWGLVAGTLIGVSFSNRCTGLFIAPVLLIATVTLFPRRWPLLGIPALAAALHFSLECLVYHQVCGDWLHSIHANLGGEGAKDIVQTPFWRLPTRYLGAVLHGGRLSLLYSALAAVGLYSAWRGPAKLPRLIAIWFGVLYLEYNCMVQSLHPLKPLLGNTVRYIAAFSLPLALLSVLGARGILVYARHRFRRPTRNLHSLPAGAFAFALLALLSSRPFFDLGFIRDLTRHMAGLPADTKIFTHRAMYDLGYLVAPDLARRFTWFIPHEVFTRNDEAEEAARHADEFWYLRKIAWLRERKKIERHQVTTQPALASYFDAIESTWALRGAYGEGDGIELALYHRRPADTHPRILEAKAPELQGLFPSLPLVWKASNQHPEQKSLLIPNNLRGRLVTIQVEGSSPKVEPIVITLDFLLSGGRHQYHAARPIFYPNTGRDFFTLTIPPDALSCIVKTAVTGRGSELCLTGFRMIIDEHD